MSTPTFQSRIDFLSKGLAPVNATTLAGLVAEDRDCAICTEELTCEDAIQLPCKHMFGKSCVEAWLKLPGKNTCPSCRQVLFSIPYSESTNPLAARAQLIFRAARAAGLPMDQMDQINFFGIWTISGSAMARALPAAAQYLVFSPEPEQSQSSGPATLNWRTLQEHFVTMGNLLPSLAAHQDRPYSRQQQGIWVAILIRLRAILARSDGDHYDAMTLPLQLRSRLRLGLTNSNVNADTLAFFDDASDFGRDLNTMLSFLAHISFQFRIEEDRRRQQRAARRAAVREVKVSSRQCIVM